MTFAPFASFSSQFVFPNMAGALSANLPGHSGEKYYLTTAISYTNGYPHMGHAYEFLTSDAIVRYHRALGYDTYFLTGTDEHGQKVAASAELAGLSPKEHCDIYVSAFKSLGEKLLISYSDFIRTTDPHHERTSQKLWKMCADSGDIYLDSYEGWYNEREECFVTNADAEAADFKDVGSGLPLKKVKEESYFFKMSEYTDRLIKYIEENPSFIEPEQYRNNIMARLVKEGLKDLSISRTSFSWGIPVPEGFDSNHVMYVWFDALSNYLSGVDALSIKPEPLSTYWPAAKHIIGKDIIWFHCVIWPCMLMSAKLPLPGGVFSHGFINGEDGRKMSKSYNNAVSPDEILAKYSADTIRYYFCASTTYGTDINFSESSLITMHNSELADVLGNLVHRVLNLAQKYCDGKVPDCEHDLEFHTPFDLRALKDAVRDDMSKCALNLALFRAMEAVRATNRFLTEAEPWKIKGEGASIRQCAIVRTALEAIYAFSHFLAPVIPMAAQCVFTELHTEPVCSFNLRDDFYNLIPGTTVSLGKILFQKIEIPTATTVTKVATAGTTKKGKGGAAAVSVESVAADHDIDFTKIEFRVGRIIKIWPHPTAERLYCEDIDMGVTAGAGGGGGGGESVRQVASGLRAYYTEEQLLGRLVVVVCNLKESKFQGFLSSGMVLAAKSEDGQQVELVDVPEGSILGERIYLQDLSTAAGASSSSTISSTPAPLSAAQVKKLKVWEAVSPDLHTSDSGVACWKHLALNTSVGQCRVATLVDSLIS